MTFNINNYKGKYAMRCKTKAEATEFIKTLAKNRIAADGMEVNRDNCEFLVDCIYSLASWSEFKHQTCYWPHETSDSIDRCYRKWYQDKGYTILEWSDFTTKGDDRNEI